MKALAVLAIVGLVLLVGLMSYEDEVNEEAYYWEMVNSES